MASSTTVGILGAIIGAAAIGASFLIPGSTVAVLGLTKFLFSAGSGLFLSGVGTLIAGNHNIGYTTAERNPIAPWRVMYGFGQNGGSLVYMNSWGQNNEILDLVIVLAAHQCQGGDLSLQSAGPHSPAVSCVNRIPELLFEQSRIQIDRSSNGCCLFGILPGTGGSPTSGTSFSPLNQSGSTKVEVASATRANGVVTMKLTADIPYLSPSDQIQVIDVGNSTSPLALTFNGQFIISSILGRGGSFGALSFTYIDGGLPGTVISTGYVQTLWKDYGPKTYIEFMDGSQSIGQSFLGMQGGTPLDGISGAYNIGPNTASQLNDGSVDVPNPWTSYCSLAGKACVFLRMHYDAHYFPQGLPQISFIMYGKNDVFDPRLGNYGDPNTKIYTTNAALCIADFLHIGTPNSAAWSPSTVYAAGSVASYQPSSASVGVDYVSYTSGNTNNEPDTSTANWTPVTPTTQPTNWISGATYASSVSYTAGQLVQYSTALIANAYVPNRQFVCLQSHTSTIISPIPPTTSPTYWAELPINVFIIPDYGYKLTYGTDIPLTQLTNSANICDIAVPLLNSGTEPMYSCNGIFTLEMKRGEILQNLLTCCAGRITTTEGQYIIWPGYWVGPGSPPLQLNLQELSVGPPRIKPMPSIRDLYNGVKGTYIAPSNHWQAADFPYYAQDAIHGYNGPAQYDGDINLAADGGDRRWLDIHLPFTTSYSMAQRIAKIELLRRRHFVTATFVLNMTAYQLVPMDIFEATFTPLLNWSNYEVEVEATRFTVIKQNDSQALAIEVDLQETDNSIYLWSTDEELTPFGYQQATFPTASVAESAPYPWSPGYVAPLAGDATYPQGVTGPASFGLEPVYGIDASGNPIVTLQIKGAPPINGLDTGLFGPYLYATLSTSGGSLGPGLYSFAMTANDGGSPPFKNTPYANIASVSIPSGSTNSITLTINYGSGDDGGEIYMALQQYSAAQGAQLSTAGQTSIGYQWHYVASLDSSTMSYTVTTFDQSTSGGIDTVFDHFNILWVPEVHAGVWAQQVQAVTTNTITIGDVSPTGTVANQWAGYTLSLLGKYNLGVEVPILNMPVQSNTATSTSGSPAVYEYTLTIGPNSASVQLPDLTTLLDVGDLVVMRDNATFTAGSFSDPNIANSYYPTGATGVERGHRAVVLSGPDAGDVQVIGNVAQDGFGNYTIFELAGQWQVTPNAGDLVIIVDNSRVPGVDTPPFSTPNRSAIYSGGSPGTIVHPVIAQPQVTNLENGTWFLTVRTCMVNETHCPDFLAPVREIYQFGSQGTLFVTS